MQLTHANGKPVVKLSTAEEKHLQHAREVIAKAGTVSALVAPAAAANEALVALISAIRGTQGTAS